MIQKRLEIINRLGLHARASAKLAKLSSQFGSMIKIQCNGQSADAKSIMGIMMLAASNGSQVDVTVEGDDELAAMRAIEDLFQDRFSEEF